MKANKINKIKSSIKKTVENKDYSNLHILFGDLINEILKSNVKYKETENITFLINDLVSLNNDYINEAIGTSLFIDLWVEFKKNEDFMMLFKSKLNKNSLVLFYENIDKWEDVENPDYQ